MRKRQIPYKTINDLFIIACWLLFLWTMLSIAWYKRYGVTHLLWFCDISLLLTAIGLFLRSSILVTAQLVAVLIFHIVWNIDFWCYLASGYMLMGSTSYMFYSEISWMEKGLSFFTHLFIVPCTLYGVYIIGISRKAWLLQWAQTVLVFLLTYLLTRPEENINWLFGTDIFNISPQTTHPLLYYGAMMLIPPFVVYWPTNKLLVLIMGQIHKRRNVRTLDMVNANIKDSGKLLRPLIMVTILLLSFFISMVVSFRVDRIYRINPTYFQMVNNSEPLLETMPVSRVKTNVSQIRFGTENSTQYADLLALPLSRKLPKQWFEYDNKLHVHTKAILQEVQKEQIPSVPQEIILEGFRSIPRSVVWGVVASDDFYVQTLCDLYVRRDKYELRCQIGGRGIAEFVSPTTGDLYLPTAHNEIIGSGIGAIYAICAIEVFDRKVVSRSAFYLVKRKGIRSPNDIWFVTKNGVLTPLLSNPLQPSHSLVAFESSSNADAAVSDVFVCDFFGYDIKNLTYDSNTFNSFVAPNQKSSDDIGWISPEVLRYYTKAKEKYVVDEIVIDMSSFISFYK